MRHATREWRDTQRFHAKWQRADSSLHPRQSFLETILARFLDRKRALRRDRLERRRALHTPQLGARHLPSVPQPLPRVVAAAAHAFVRLARLRTPGELGVKSADRTMLALRAAVHTPRAGTTAPRRGCSAETRAGAATARAGAFAAPVRLGADARRLAVSRGAWPRDPWSPRSRDRSFPRLQTGFRSRRKTRNVHSRSRARRRRRAFLTVPSRSHHHWLPLVRSTPVTRTLVPRCCKTSHALSPRRRVPPPRGGGRSGGCGGRGGRRRRAGHRHHLRQRRRRQDHHLRQPRHEHRAFGVPRLFGGRRHRAA